MYADPSVYISEIYSAFSLFPFLSWRDCWIAQLATDYFSWILRAPRLNLTCLPGYRPEESTIDTMCKILIPARYTAFILQYNNKNIKKIMSKFISFSVNVLKTHFKHLPARLLSIMYSYYVEVPLGFDQSVRIFLCNPIQTIERYLFYIFTATIPILLIKKIWEIMMLKGLFCTYIIL